MAKSASHLLIAALYASTLLPAGQLVLGEVEGILQVNYGSSSNGKAGGRGSGGLMLLVGAWLVSPQRGRLNSSGRQPQPPPPPQPGCGAHAGLQGAWLGPMGACLPRHVMGTES